MLTSTCSHSLYLSQMSAMDCKSSNAPRTVVPAVALTKNGICPLLLCSRIRRSSSEVIILPWLSEGTMMQLSVPKPPTEAQDLTE